jgi:hypothetical protein
MGSLKRAVHATAESLAFNPAKKKVVTLVQHS